MNQKVEAFEWSQLGMKDARMFDPVGLRTDEYVSENERGFARNDQLFCGGVNRCHQRCE